MNIQVRLENGVARVEFDRPDQRNAIDTSTWSELGSALTSVRNNTDVKVLIVGSTSTDFCVGADLSAADDAPTSHRSQLERMQWINSIVNQLHALPIPTIARVDGLAVGIGMNLAIGCDFVIASDRARFAEIFIKRALTIDGGGTWLLPKLVGIRQAFRLAMTGEMVSADEAAYLGLITSVVPQAKLDDTISELTARLRGYSPSALAQMKSLLNESHDANFEQALESEARVQSLNVAGDDFKAAIAAFSRQTRSAATNPTGAAGG